MSEFTYPADWGNVKLSFSSESNRDRFHSKITEYYNGMVYAMANAVGCTFIDPDDSKAIAAIRLYNRIERRGFCIMWKGVVIDGWRSNLKCGGLILTLKNWNVSQPNLTTKLTS